jgi:hypothetical protein
MVEGLVKSSKSGNLLDDIYVHLDDDGNYRIMRISEVWGLLGRNGKGLNVHHQVRRDLTNYQTFVKRRESLKGNNKMTRRQKDAAEEDLKRKFLTYPLN